MRQPQTHYDVLKVSKQASSDELRAAFKKIFLALQYGHHSGSQEDVARHLEVVKKSYSVLSDPVKRGLYDQLISESNRDDFPDQTQTLQAEPSNGGEAQPSDAPAQ